MSKVNERFGTGNITPPAGTPQGKPAPASGGRPASSPRHEGLSARNGPASASMAPRQAGPQAPALGVPVYLPQVAGESGRGGFMQRVRDAIQEIRQFPQQLHQLAQHATHCQPNLLQHALQTAHHTVQTLQSGAQPAAFNPHLHSQVPAMGIPAAWLQPPPAPMKPVAEPMVLIPRPQVQGAAQMFNTQVHSFDPALLSQQLSPVMQQMLQKVLDNIRQLQALAADNQHMGVTAALAGVSPGAAPHKAQQG